MKLIIYIDGACRGNPGEGAIGVIIKDHNGQILEEISKLIGLCTNNIAEYQALINALQVAKKRGGTEITVFSDSMLLVNQIKGAFAVKNSTLRSLYLIATRLAAFFASFEMIHIMREQNREADALANQAFASV